METGLHGRCAVVLGASDGLGLGVARMLDEERAHVVLAARRADLVRQHAGRLRSAIGVRVDLSDPSATADLIDQAVRAFGPVSILVLNGGGPPPGRADGLGTEQIEASMRTLLLAQQQLVSTVLPAMRAQRWGRVIAIGSSGVQQPLGQLALSNIGRAALAAYLKTLAAEVAPDGVTVNMVLPGRIDTRRVSDLDQAAAKRESRTAAEVRATSESSIPAGRYGTTEEFASVVIFLASERASYVTGEQIRCDGGLVRAY